MTSSVLATFDVPRLTTNGVRTVRACIGDRGVTAVVSTDDNLDDNDDNGARDIYVIDNIGPLALSVDGAGIFRAGESIDPQVSADCQTVTFASTAQLVAPNPPGFVQGNRFFYVVKDGGLVAPIVKPDGSIAVDLAQEGRLSRGGGSFSFVLGQENAKNLIVYDVGTATAVAALNSIPGDIDGNCPLYDEVHDLLLFQSVRGFVGEDTDDAPDLYIARNPLTAPSFVRIGSGFVVDLGASNFTHACNGATIATEPVVAAAPTPPLQNPPDNDGTADVYSVIIPANGSSALTPTLTSFNVDAACGPFSGEANVTFLVDVADDGRFLIVSASGGASGRLGRMFCP